MLDKCNEETGSTAIHSPGAYAQAAAIGCQYVKAQLTGAFHRVVPNALIPAKYGRISLINSSHSVE